MRTYSHAILTYRAFRRLGGPDVTAASRGAVLADLPLVAWLAANRLGRFSCRDFEVEVCGRGVFAAPDAALYSALPYPLRWRRHWPHPSASEAGRRGAA